MSILLNPREYVLKSELRMHCPGDVGSKEWEDFVDLLPAEDVVSRELFDQIKWELSVAIEQLKKLGHNFAENIEGGNK